MIRRRLLGAPGVAFGAAAGLSAVLTLADGTTLQLTYTAPNSGTYLISKSAETGTFSST